MIYLGNQAVGLATSLPVFSDIAQIEIGSYTPTVDESVSTKTFTHSLGTIPDFILWFTTDLIVASEENQVAYMVNGYIATRNVQNSDYSAGTCANYTLANQAKARATASNSQLTIWTTDSTFKFFDVSDIFLKANVKYNYIIGKFKEQEVTANV